MRSRFGRAGLALALLALLECLFAQVGWAKTYYVATWGNDPATHVDGVDGTKTNPWKSINYGDAKRILLPGDKVVVAAGHYYAPNTANGWIIGYCSGTPENPITYVAQGRVILDGSVQAGGVPRTVDGTVVLIGHATGGSDNSGRADYIVFDGFEIIGSSRCLDVKQYNNLTYAETGVIVRNCILRDPRTKSGGAGGQMIMANGIHDCQFYNNIIAITDTSLLGAARAFASQNNACRNKFFNNTIYINGPATTVSPQVLNGAFFITDLNKTCVGILDWTKLEWGVNDETGDWTEYAWNVCKTPDDPPAPGDPPGTDYRNVLKNNIIWVKNPLSHGIWNTCNPVIYPPGGYSSRGHDPGLVHSNNVFSPAGVNGVGGLRYVVDFLLDVEPGVEDNCPFPEDAYPHIHTFYPTEFETNSLSFVSTDPNSPDFFKLPAGSPAIDAGVDMGLPYYGTAPDLGAVEYIPSAYATGSIKDALGQADGSVIKLSNVVVTVGNGTLLNNVIYVEEEARTAGVAVQSSPMLTQVTEGQRIEVTGTLDKSGPQPIIRALNVKLVGGSGGGFADETPLKPLGTPNKSAAGEVGLDNTGMLVTIWGKVTAVDSSYFCVDDGSGRTDGMGHAGIPVLISEQTTPITTPTESYVAVTGVLGKKDLGGGAVTVIRPRAQTDIR